jgi:hypothetical protein
MGVWVLREREREEERKEGFEVVVVAAMGVDVEEREKKVILIVCGKVFSFSCKIPMWHVRIGGCKHQFYTQSVLNLISSFPLSITSHNYRLMPFGEKISLFIGIIFSASYWIQQTHFTFTPFLSLSLSGD